VRELFAGTRGRARVRARPQPVRFDSAEHFVVFFESNYGPTLKARERLEAEGRWAELREELHALAERHNETSDGQPAHAGGVPGRGRPKGLNR
jgi:hypothetical protein